MAGFIFDIDGVLADTKKLHCQSWHAACKEKDLEGFVDKMYLDNCGMKREDSAKLFMNVLTGECDSNKAHELAEAKNRHYKRMIEEGLVPGFSDALGFLVDAYTHGARIAYASSSTNAEKILSSIKPTKYLCGQSPNYGLSDKTNLKDIFDGLGVYGEQEYPGKPEPFIFLHAASLINLHPDQCAVLEDAVAGVQAAKKGGFYCIGLARDNDERALREAGADKVYTRLPEGEYWRTKSLLDNHVQTQERYVRDIIRYAVPAMAHN